MDSFDIVFLPMQADQAVRSFPRVRTLVLEQPITAMSTLQRLVSSASQLTCLEMGVTCTCCPANTDLQLAQAWHMLHAVLIMCLHLHEPDNTMPVQVAKLADLDSFTLENSKVQDCHACCVCTPRNPHLLLLCSIPLTSVRRMQALTDNGLHVLSALQMLRELNLISAGGIEGTGLTSLLHAQHLRVCTAPMLQSISAFFLSAGWRNPGNTPPAAGSQDAPC